jgi:ParB family chromosome partitioning protein
MSQKTIQQIPLDKIVAGKQVRERFDEASLTGLAQSIRETGQHQPIHLCPIGGDLYSLLEGGRRLRALQKNGAETAEAIVEDGNLGTGEALLRQLTENLQREDLTPIEKAKAINALMDEREWTASQCAAKLGLTNGTVSKLLSLLALPEELQRQIHAGEVTASAAYQLTKLNDVSERDQLAGRVAKGEMTRDELSRAIRKGKRRQRIQKPICRAACVTARMESRQSVSVRAPTLDLNSFVSILQNLLNHAQEARAEGLTLEALVKRLEDPKDTGTASTTKTT